MGISSGYKLVSWHGGLVYKEEKYPNILFAKDGEIYDFNGKSVMPIGGARYGKQRLPHQSGASVVRIGAAG